MHNSNLNQGGFKPSFPSTSYVELHLTQVHGNLHEIVLNKLNAGKTQTQIARELSTNEYHVSQSWISYWLKSNGYKRVTRWTRSQGGES